MTNNKQELLEQLHSPDPLARENATQQLWQLFFGAAGSEAELRIVQANQDLESAAYETALASLDDLVLDFPEFAEAYNRRATLYYFIRDYTASLADCQVVIALEPDHFGAWHGLGLNYLALRRYAEGARAFRRALELQPFAEINQKLLAECLTKLN